MEHCWRTKEKNKKNPGLEHPRRSMLRPKERWRYGGSLCFPCAFPIQKILWSRASFLVQGTWFMLPLKNWLCAFQLSFFKIPFSSFTWTIINYETNSYTHTHRARLSCLALPLSCWENHLLSFGSWFPHLRLLGRFSLPLRWGRFQMAPVAARSSTIQYWKGNQTDQMRNFLSTNILSLCWFLSHIINLKANLTSMEFIRGLGNGENGGVLASPSDLI